MLPLDAYPVHLFLGGRDPVMIEAAEHFYQMLVLLPKLPNALLQLLDISLAEHKKNPRPILSGNLCLFFHGQGDAGGRASALDTELHNVLANHCVGGLCGSLFCAVCVLWKQHAPLAMKFMKIGTRPDTFYTEEATRSVISDAPSDLVIHINNITFLLHKYPLLPKCGLLQRLCTDTGDSSKNAIELHDIPGGEGAFELCAKFCYGITINLSANNFVPAFCAAKFLRMTESVEKGNFVFKLESFFNSCILEGWKDSIVTLQATTHLPEWSENLGIIRRCIDSILEKILTDPAKVGSFLHSLDMQLTAIVHVVKDKRDANISFGMVISLQVSWSYTYTRPGYNRKNRQLVPKDWWTEDISDLDIDLFRCIVTGIRSTNILPPQLIGEALHVYACRWLPDTTKSLPPEASASQAEQILEKNRRILETIVSMMPADRGSVTVGFLLRLLSIANFLGTSPLTKTELLRQSALQLEEATVGDLLFPSNLPSVQHSYDIDLVEAVIESYLVLWRRQAPAEDGPFVRSIRKVGKLVDSYLQVIARDANMPAAKIASLAEALPEIARPTHDDLYKAINIYLKEHQELTKADKKQLCRILDCQKLSPEVCAHAIRNERLPLRTVVQVLFFDHERGGSRADVHKVAKSGIEQKLKDEMQLERKESTKERVIREEGTSGTISDPKKITERKSRTEYSKGRERN
ncbi:NPH3 domain [Dillenia turbinata]|uniref:NPH3 domain n=1 Tax=Dillenia turbinata TaxID=194707 RepID=A0AAN8VMZ4_9MAGN